MSYGLRLVSLFRLGRLGLSGKVSYVRLVIFFRFDFIDLICLVKWQVLVMLS